MSIDLTLERIRLLYSRLLVYTRPTCHITGTNGKGSVSALLSSILWASSLSVGRFNSPHLISVHDSIVINNEPVSPEVYGSTRQEIESTDAKYGIGASSFEILTLTALLIFERAKLDVVVVEVGMGGRLDATNIIPDDCILVSALTAVDLDHTAFLGPTVADIAKEKAGIARQGKVFVLGQQKYIEVEGVVKSIVGGIGGQVIMAGGVEKAASVETRTDGSSLFSWDFTPPPPTLVRISMQCFSDPVITHLPLYGDHQLANLSIATTMVSTLLANPSWYFGDKITPSSVAHGIECTKWSGRLSFHTFSSPQSDVDGNQVTPMTVLTDGAHNPSSSSTLASYISHILSGLCLKFKNAGSKTISLTYILAMSHSPPKSPHDTLSPLLSVVSNISPDMHIKLSVALVGFTPPDGMPWLKPVPPSELKNIVLGLLPTAETWCANDDDQIAEALKWAAEIQVRWGKDGGLVVIAGSLYLVADFYRLVESKGRINS